MRIMVKYLYVSMLVMMLVSPLSLAAEPVNIKCPTFSDIGTAFIMARGLFANNATLKVANHTWVLKGMDEKGNIFVTNPNLLLRIDPGSTQSYGAVNTFLPNALVCEAHLKMWLTDPKNPTPTPSGSTTQLLRVMINSADMIPAGYSCTSAGDGYNCTPPAS